jgi:hypothetical protein
MARMGKCPRHRDDEFVPVCTHVLTAVNDGRPLKIFLQVMDHDHGWEAFGLCDVCMRLRPGHDIGHYVCLSCLEEWAQATGNDVLERLEQLNRRQRPADELDE